MRKTILWLAVTLWSTVALGQDHQSVFSGVIEGQVLNLDGSTASQAEVWAIPAGGPNQGTLPRSRASVLGQFSIRIQKPGRYLIIAAQKKEGYTSAICYGPQAPPEVLIDEGQPRQSAVVRLGPMLGRITGTVLDAETNRPVEKGEVELQLRSHQMALTRQGPYSKGQFELCAPPGLFSLKVSAPGYQDWYGNGSKGQPELFAVQLGDHHELTIRLRPATTR